MNLVDSDIPFTLNTTANDPIKELFTPALQCSQRFDVAVGYFTSGWLRDTAAGFAQFALSGGRSRWVVSPQLQNDDAESLIQEKDADYDVLNNYEERQLLDVIKALQDDTRKELSALICSGVIEFKIAIPRTKSIGMMHAKLGSFTDSDGSVLVFTGSYNLTSAANSNWERIDVFKSWEGTEAKRVASVTTEFDSLWSDSDANFKVLTPSKKLIEFIKYSAGPQLADYIAASKSEKMINLRPYQEEAIENWGKNGGRGTYVMATGSGKTITALATIKKLISITADKNKKPLVIVIVLPLKHLLDQWYSEALEFGLNSIKCYENSGLWRSKLAEALSIQAVTGEGFVIAMVTNSTLATPAFQAELAKINTEFLFVADEAHNLGSATYIDSLPENANRRLALSATPDRFNDAAGTKALFNYFGEPVIEFSLEDAIDQKFLCEYDYHPHLCPMSEAEYEEYMEIADAIKKEKLKTGDGGAKSKELTRLQGKRNDLITGVASKLDVLKRELLAQLDTSGVDHTLVYCGMRRGEDELRHIERTVKLMGSLSIKTRKFTADESLDDRREILNLFSSGELDSICAIKCLDEGVDVPATRVAYILASTANPREFIQRRGRVLRLSPGKEKAVIHDFLVAPPYRRNEEDDMVERELERGIEFSRLALNSDQCMDVLKEFADNFGVKLWK